uniref:Pentacotripeptide-repeat region of PRORP domain-containing protein n=1 Tax=Leersia perrieri TaxID=77586 RepID=A0A0D9UWT1_9ORYZ
MEAKGVSSNSMTYSYILKTTEKPKDVISLMQRMEKYGCRLDSDTYNLILNLYVSWNYEKGVQLVWDEMERNGSGPDQRSFTIMVHGLHSHGKLDEALQYYRTMESRGMTPEPRTKILVKAICMKKDALATEDQPRMMTRTGMGKVMGYRHQVMFTILAYYCLRCLLGASLGLHKFVDAALPDAITAISDPTIWPHEEATGTDAATATVL